MGEDARIVTLYTKPNPIAMTIFVRVQNCVKYPMDTCFSMQNTQICAVNSDRVNKARGKFFRLSAGIAVEKSFFLWYNASKEAPRRKKKCCPRRF